jgi:hypothetical protein
MRRASAPPSASIQRSPRSRRLDRRCAASSSDTWPPGSRTEPLAALARVPSGQPAAQLALLPAGKRRHPLRVLGAAPSTLSPDERLSRIGARLAPSSATNSRIARYSAIPTPEKTASPTNTIRNRIGSTSK